MRRVLVIFIMSFLLTVLIVPNVRAQSSLELKDVELWIESPSFLLIRAVVKNNNSSNWLRYRLRVRAWPHSTPDKQIIVADRYASINNGSENHHWLTVPNALSKRDNGMTWLKVVLYESNESSWSGWLQVDHAYLYLNLSENREETITQLSNSISELQDSIQNLQIQLILLSSILGISIAIIVVFLVRKYWKLKYIPDSVEAEWADKKL